MSHKKLRTKHKFFIHWLRTTVAFACIPVFAVLVFSSHLDVVQAKKNPKLPDGFPRLANYFLDPEISQAEAEELAQWDIVILGFETQYNSPEAFTKMREINPDIITLAYVASEEVPIKHLSQSDEDNPIYKLYNRLNRHDNWFLKNSQGEYVNFYPDTRMINVTTRWKKALPKFITNQVLKNNKKKWDGVFYDNCFNNVAWTDAKIDVDRDGQADNWNQADKEWKTGMRSMMKQTRKQNKNSMIVCNSNGDFYTYINGRLIEAFPSEFDGNWGGSMEKYFNVLKQGKDPSLVIVNTVANSTDDSNYRLMRFNLTSSLMGDGFASFDQSVDFHHSLWWYDEYSVALGNPLGGTFNVETNAGPDNVTEGIWRRNFQRGIVFVNSTNQPKRVQLEDGFEKILGTQDTQINNGKLIGTITVPANDGIILLGRITQVTNAPFLNGAFAKVFTDQGTQPRKPFFTYNSSFPGSSTILYLEDINTTLVADETYVSVYENGRLLTKFAPYGDRFIGGINIDADRLYGPNKGYTIVTGTKQYGPHVRMYNIKGQLVNTGCFPYEQVFDGGVNIAIGDVVKSNPGKEIVVAAAQGGGPHIRILSRDCKLISPGFFAYDQSMHAGVSVGAGDLNGDGKDEIVTIPGKGATPLVKIFNDKGESVAPDFYAFSPTDRSGANITISDVDGDGVNEIVAMSFSIFNQ